MLWDQASCPNEGIKSPGTVRCAVEWLTKKASKVHSDGRLSLGRVSLPPRVFDPMINQNCTSRRPNVASEPYKTQC